MSRIATRRCATTERESKKQSARMRTAVTFRSVRRNPRQYAACGCAPDPNHYCEESENGGDDDVTGANGRENKKGDGDARI